MSIDASSEAVGSLYQAVMERSGDAIYVCDMDGLFVDVNPQACASTGYTREELLGLSVLDVDPNFTPEAAAQLWQAMAAGEITRLETSHRRKDGTTFPVELSIGVAHHAGRPLLLATARDVTRRVAREEQLRALGEEHDRTRRNLKHVLDAMDALVVVTAADTHEILFVNRYGRRHFCDDDDAPGWAFLHAARAAQCPDCDCSPDDADAVAVWDLTHPTDDRLFECRHRGVRWFDGRRAVLEIATDVTARRRAERKASFLAEHDALTGQANRARLRAAFEQLVEDNERPEMALLFIDLDRFKPINDTFGHEAGDHVLITLAERLRAAVRQRDVVCRYGGDEFVLLLWDAGDQRAAARRVAGEVLAALRRPIPLFGGAAQVSGSVGVALYPQHARDLDALLGAADGAMYLAKAAGAGLVRFADDPFDL